LRERESTKNKYKGGGGSNGAGKGRRKGGCEQVFALKKCDRETKQTSSKKNEHFWKEYVASLHVHLVVFLTDT
jgi:hypothetical protein